MQSSSQKINQKTKLLKVRFFSQSLQKFERTFTVLGEKHFGRDIKIETCSYRLIRSNKKSNFCKISFFSKSSELWTNIYRAWRKSSGQGYQNWKLYSMSSEYHFEVKKKFLKVVSFHFFRTWNIIVLYLRQQRFHPVCQKCHLRVYMNSLRGVGIRSDISWRETFFEHWRKNFDLFLKTAFYVSKGTFWVKKSFFWKFCFFQTLRNFERNFTVLGEKVSGREIKIEKCSFRLIRSIKKSNFWKFSFFQILQNFERTITVLGGKLFGRDIKIENCSLRLKNHSKNQTSESSLFFNFFRTLNEHLPCLAENFRQGYQNWKLQSSSQKINQKTKLLKVLFFSNSSELWTNIYRASRKTFRQGYQNWNLQSSSHKIKQKIKLLKNLFFFSKSSELWTNIYRAWRKSFGQGYQTWKLYSMSSEYQFEDKNSFLKVLYVFICFGLGTWNFWICGDRVFTRVVKMYSTWLYEFSLRCW